MFIQKPENLLIPYARRVEALCHAELQHVNEIVDCNACVAYHMEWLRTSVAEAIAVVQKWTAWIQTEPYKSPKQNMAENQGCKKDSCSSNDMERLTEDMDAFMQMMRKLAISEAEIRDQ